MTMKSALACVAGDMDLVRPLGLAGIPCAIVAPAGAPTRYSRFRHALVEWADAWERPEAFVEALIRFASAQRERPVLFYEEDGDLLRISEYRDSLATVFRFVIADRGLVRDLVDKARFQALAARLNLPVPRGCCVDPATEPAPATLGLRFPVIVKPLTRRPTRWAPVGGSAKARQVNSEPELDALWPLLAAARMPVLVQELVPGTEAEIESYHVYVDERDRIAAEFTGRKVRTYPARYGDSTALVITDAADVRRIGRDVVRRLGLRGVAKFDFKRAPDGSLYLLEINPRFTLWHHPGALAGVNIPELVYRDLTGMPRPDPRPARAGVRWCRLWTDVHAAREHRIPFVRWASWALRCDAKSAVAWDDPLPLVGALAWRGWSRLVFSHRLQEDANRC